MTKISLIPRVSEKAYQMSQSPEVKTYIFEVPLSANKLTISQAVSEEYKVEVESVRTVVVKGKTKQTYRKGSRPQIGRRSDFKKAYVTLVTGDSIPLFVEEAEQEAKIAEEESKQAKKASKNKSKDSNDQNKESK